MRFVNLHVRTAVLASAILMVCSCQSAQKPVALVPPAAAPALKPVPASVATAQPAQDPVSPQADEALAQKPASPDASSSATPASDAVADLVSKAEKEYQAGLANYHANQAEEARQNFDNALNALLGSNLDIRSDNRLQVGI